MDLRRGDLVWYADGIVEPRLVRLLSVARRGDNYVARFRLAGIVVERTLSGSTVRVAHLSDGTELADLSAEW